LPDEYGAISVGLHDIDRNVANLSAVMRENLWFLMDVSGKPLGSAPMVNILEVYMVENA